jgi:Raf kinase inhibitor-like YbhB/YbcL family protein
MRKRSHLWFGVAIFSGSLVACGEAAAPVPMASGGAATAAGGASSSGGSVSSSGGSISGGQSSMGGGASGGNPSGGSSSGGEPSLGGATTSGGAANSSGGAEGESGGSATSGGSGSGGGSGKFALQSPEWDVVDNEDCTAESTEACATYPIESTNLNQNGPKNVSPEMSWINVPEGTQSFVVLLQDLSNGFAHWVLWDIPADVTLLPADLAKTATLTDPEGAQQIALNGNGYFGSGACGNVYEHRVYALAVPKLNPAMQNSASNVRTAVMALGDDSLAESFARMQSRNCN